MNRLFRLLGYGDFAMFMIEPISWRHKNITIGIHTQDSFEILEDDSQVDIHTIVIGFFFFRLTFEFVNDYQ